MRRRCRSQTLVLVGPVLNRPSMVWKKRYALLLLRKLGNHIDGKDQSFNNSSRVTGTSCSSRQ